MQVYDILLAHNIENPRLWLIEEVTDFHIVAYLFNFDK